MRSGNTGSVDQAPPDQRSGHCPQVNELSAFSRGALPLAALHSIAEHVSVCVACDSKVSTLVSELEHRLTQVNQAADAQPVASPPDGGHLDLAEAHIEASAAAPVVEEEGPTAPLRLGQYRLMRQIGRGGMGVVYQARHEKLLRDVAIKFVPIETIKDLLDVTRLQREMAAAGTMRHPNVVYATDAGESEGVHYLVMEYVEGIDLSKLVWRVGPLPVADACEIIRQAAEGLAHVEQQQLVHRDLKPSNLMLAADGTVKILDLGLARASIGQTPDHELTRNGYLLGTIDYVAPEQARDAHAADIRSDIYSLGCTFYRLLAGEPPFGGQRHSSVASKILAHERIAPPQFSQFRQDVPPAVEAVVRKMLAKDPAERFQSPVELRQALAPLAAGADFPSLLKRAKVAPARIRAAQAPITTPHRHDRTPQAGVELPQPAARTPRWQVWLALAAGAIVLGGIALGLPRLGGPKDTGTPTCSDISRANEVPYNGVRVGVSSVSHPAAEMIALESDYIQLVQLGYLRPGRQKFAVTIDQSKSNWIGQFGIFLGYRDEFDTTIAKRGTQDETETLRFPVGTFQILLFDHDPRGDGKDPRGPKFQVWRERVFIHPMLDDSPTLYRLDPPKEITYCPIPQPGQVLRLEIEFNDAAITSFRINGTEMDDLTSQEMNARFTPKDFAGPFGLYNAGNYSARFTKIDFSALSKEPAP
ncbi:MAG TPA: serine/threonine-protein kinase [Pirellulaceae bacterium]|nr:serine/threonine-protein kinase [Pirellulaceae bacterium]